MFIITITLDQVICPRSADPSQLHNHHHPYFECTPGLCQWLAFRLILSHYGASDFKNNYLRLHPID